MKLLRLYIETFRCLDRVDLAFGPGLNVIYGPNERGKSTVVEAIRAALLTPHTSSHADSYRQWRSDDPARVILTLEFEPGQIWRVHKTFGPSATALLEFSPDGQRFSRECGARKVDAKLGELLRWGVREPGGRGGKRGLPTSFITEVLFPQQDAVTGLFGRSLQDDEDGSGRQLLTEVLGAMAQDPRFKRILQQAQHHVDQAFTPTGRKSTKKDSPFAAIREAIQRADQDYDALYGDVQKADAVHTRIQELANARLHQEATLQHERDVLEDLQGRWARNQARRSVEGAVQTARAEQARVQAVLDAVGEAAAQIAELTQALAIAEDALGKADAHCTAVGRDLDRAKECVRTAESQESAQQAALDEQKLQNRLLDIKQQAGEARQRLERAQRLLALERDVAALNAQCAAEEQRSNTLRAQAAESEQRVRAREQEIALFEGAAVVLKLKGVRQRFNDAEQAAERARVLRQQMTARLADADTREAELRATTLPSQDTLDALRELWSNLQLARAQLEVGLRITVTPARELDVHVAVDQGPLASRPLSSQALNVEAEREVTLRIENIADVTVAGGRADARAAWEALNRRWEREGRPVLAAADTDSLDAVARACRDAEARRQAVKALRLEADSLGREAQSVDRQAADYDDLRQRLGNLEHALNQLDRAEVDATIRTLGLGSEADLEAAQRRSATALEDARRQARDTVAPLAESTARLGAARDRITAQTALRDQLAGQLDGDGATAVAQATAALAALDAQRREAEDALATRQQSQQAALAEARTRCRQVEATLAAAADSRRAAQVRRDGVATDLAGWQAKLTERQTHAAQVDAAAAAARVATLTQELEQLPASDVPVGADDVARQQQAVADAVRQLEGAVKAANEAHGALQQVGGDVVRDRMKVVETVRQQLREQESDLEVEYGAWQLLHATLREAENAESAHLGQALGRPIAEEIRALTRNRYDRVELDAHLRAGHVVVGGDEHRLDELSVGAQEQFATLFRVILARQLGTTLILDDQLVQSDPQRMRQLSTLLRDDAERLQTLIFTCRPLDYLDAAELPPADAADVTAEAGASATAAAVRATAPFRDQGLVRAIEFGDGVSGDGA